MPSEDEPKRPEPSRLYLPMIVAWIALGVILSAVTSQITKGWILPQWPAVPTALFYIAIFAAVLTGGHLWRKWSSPAVSLMGYAVLASAAGLIAGPLIATYGMATALKALSLMALIAGMSSLFVATLSKDLSAARGWFLGALIVAVGTMFTRSIMTTYGLLAEDALPAVNWAVVLIFTGLVVFRMNRAVHLPHTRQNAIDVSVPLFLFLFCIFINGIAVVG
jgi:FtsH-binding integral membrane protein